MKLTNISKIILMFVVIASCSGLNTKEEIAQLQKEVQLTLNRVQQKIQDNPESVLQNSISALDSILEYTEMVKSDPSKFSPEKLQAYILKINIINENMERFSDLTLQTDVSFPLGTYQLKHLSEKGKNKIDGLADKIVASVQEMAKKYPQKQITIMLKTIGYTDETDIIAGGSLEQALIQSIPQTIESEPNKRRKQYNKILSEFRASTLNKYVVRYIQQRLPSSYQVEITTEINGLGEKLPNEKLAKSTYQNKDPRRRVCIISPFIEIIP